jgi:16S rRNA processing protein RimM
VVGACGWMSSTPIGSTEYLVGVAVRTHGLRGELVVEVHTDSPGERFAPGVSLIAQRPGAPAGTLTVESARPHSGRLLVRFVEAPDRDAAEALRGTRLLVPAESVPPSDDDEEFHVHQLEGLRAELEDGSVVGSVREVTCSSWPARSAPTRSCRSCWPSCRPSTWPPAAWSSPHQKASSTEPERDSPGESRYTFHPLGERLGPRRLRCRQSAGGMFWLRWKRLSGS